jgi:hypothetical protein
MIHNTVKYRDETSTISNLFLSKNVISNCGSDNISYEDWLALTGLPLSA